MDRQFMQFSLEAPRASHRWGIARQLCSIGAALAAACLSVVAPAAKTLHVPSEYPTIQVAVNAAADEDSILVAAGSYSEPAVRILGKTLLVAGAGRDETFISSAPAIGFLIDNQANVTMTGFDITSGGGQAAPSFEIGSARLTLISSRIHNSNGGGTGGGAIDALLDANVICNDVLFVGNTGIVGAVIISGGQIAHFTRCRFENNVTNRNFNGAGAVDVVAQDVRFMDCDFIGNKSVAGFKGLVGGLHFSGELGGAALVERCLFVGNEGTSCGAILAELGGSLTIRNCTIDDNTGHEAVSAVGVALGGPPTQLENCIVTRNVPTPAFSCAGGLLQIECSDVWGNADDTICPGGANNISADPQYCGADRWDLQADSPCAAEISPICGLIGGRDVGCGPDAVEPTTWGQIKGIWRR